MSVRYENLAAARRRTADLTLAQGEVSPRHPGPRFPAGFLMTANGLVWSDPSDLEGSKILVCGPFEVLAETRDNEGWSWGLLLRWKDRDGRAHEWAMPRSLLAADGVDVQRCLLDRSLDIQPGTKAKNLLLSFFIGVRVESRARAVQSTGWHGSTFVLPDEAIAEPDGEQIILQITGGLDHAYRTRGTLEGWQQEVARYAVGNSRLTLAISAALAAALLGPCGAESGGFHLRGPSSIGKSTALHVAGSVWGGDNYVRAWRATANGLEAVASLHNDALLCLDELAQLSSREAGEVAYMLANGRGKARASRDALLRKPASWRLMFLSSGEIGLAEKIAEDSRTRRQTAGQKVRVIDIPADTGTYGLFERLHHFEDAGSLAKHLTAAARQQFGTSARAFIEAIAPDLEAVVPSAIEGVRGFVADHCPLQADGQVKRVAERFGLVGITGELAATLGIVPWDSSEALAAAGICFRAWLGARGGVEPAEVTDGIAAVRGFVSAHGESRFSPAWERGTDPIRIHNLAGYRKQVETGDGSAWDYYVTPQAWAEVCSGYEKRALAKIMAERGLLKTPRTGSHFAEYVRVPGQGTRRLYHLSAQILEGDDD